MYLKTNPDPDRMCYSHFTVATGYIFKKIKNLSPCNYLKCKLQILKFIYYIITFLSPVINLNPVPHDSCIQ